MADRPTTTDEGAAVAKILIGLVNECDTDVDVYHAIPTISPMN